MSRLITTDPDIQLMAEPEGFEYGYYAFDNINPIETQAEINGITARRENENPIKMPNEDVVLPIANNKLIELQQREILYKYNKYA